MTATVEQVSKLRRMIAEPTTALYPNEALKNYIESYPVMDANGVDPNTAQNESWIPTYDMNAAAAEIWDEKAAVLQDKYDFSADGGSYHRSQAHEQACKMAAKYRSRAYAKSALVRKWPTERHVFGK